MITIAEDYKLLSVNNGEFTPEIAEAARFVLIVGKSAAGKTTLAQAIEKRWPEHFQQLPKVMTRLPRQDETLNKDIIRYDEDNFIKEMSHGRFFAAYNFTVGNKSKFSGVLNQTLIDCVKNDIGGLIIVPAYTIPIFRNMFPHTKVIVVNAPPDDHRKFLNSRKHAPTDPSMQNGVGVCCIDIDLNTELGLAEYFIPKSTFLLNNRYGSAPLNTNGLQDFLFS